MPSKHNLNSRLSKSQAKRDRCWMYKSQEPQYVLLEFEKADAHNLLTKEGIHYILTQFKRRAQLTQLTQLTQLQQLAQRSSYEQTQIPVFSQIQRPNFLHFFSFSPQTQNQALHLCERGSENRKAYANAALPIKWQMLVA